MIAQRLDVVLRHATEADLPAIDGLTALCYEAVGFDRSVPTVDLWQRL